jgi:acyl carrier protein
MYAEKVKEKAAWFDEQERDRIFGFIQECLTDMGIDSKEIHMDSLLVSEFGMNSIDLADLTFRLEDRYKISIPRNGIRESVRDIIPDEEFSKGGRITDKGLVLLKEMFGGDVKGIIRPGLHIHDLSELLSVGAFVYMTMKQLLRKSSLNNDYNEVDSSDSKAKSCDYRAGAGHAKRHDP